MPQQWLGQQRAAFPNKLRRYSRMHTCSPWPVLEHMAQTHASRLTIFICWASSSAKVPSRVDNSLSAKARIFLILALPTRECPWSKASRRPPSQEWRTRRKELFRLGAQKATSSDCKTVFSSQTTQRQCYSWSLEGRLDFMSPANQIKSKEEMLPRTWRRLFGLMRDSWPAPQWWRAAPQPASWFEGARAPHVMNIPLSAHQGSDMVTFKRNWPSFAVLVKIPPPPPGILPQIPQERLFLATDLKLSDNLKN